MWYDEAVFYQIYPLGFCGALDAPRDGQNRIGKVKEWIPHLQKLGVTAVLFNPVFASDFHGYDTEDLLRLDSRLGTDDDFASVCSALHEAGMRVILDGVFHHVGRNFPPFRDVREHREQSRYASWFHIDFGGNTGYGDGFWYEPWEGHYELVKLNLDNPEVRNYLYSCVGKWMDRFGIDGLRLDVAYLLPDFFLSELRDFCLARKSDFFLVGEILGGDYNRLLNILPSCTNYECRKGLYSSFQSMNLFEIGYSLNRQFGNDPWTLYRGRHLLTFADNHDVDRAASLLTDKRQLTPLYGLMFGMPGIPCLYYGSEWGAEGTKHDGSDLDLRPSFDSPEWNDLTSSIAAFAAAHHNSEALCYGEYRQVLQTNKQLIFERKSEHERVLVAVNAADETFHADFNAECGCAIDLTDGTPHDFGAGSDLEPYCVYYWKCEK
ncbi:MAG: alpha-amylase family glycosyl hydrolase [Acutalibacteraceae bacterium]